MVIIKVEVKLNSTEACLMQSKLDLDLRIKWNSSGQHFSHLGTHSPTATEQLNKVIHLGTQKIETNIQFSQQTSSAQGNRVLQLWSGNQV